MEKIIISEEQVKKVLDNLLNEEMSKVSRHDFSRTQFKIEELQNSLNEVIKEFRKLQDSIPIGLKNATNKKIVLISGSLYEAQHNIYELKENVKAYKRKTYGQQIVEKK